MRLTTQFLKRKVNIIFSLTVIEYLNSQTEGKPQRRIAYYYFDFSDSGKHTSIGCFQSLARQLLSQFAVIPEILRPLYLDCNGGTPNLISLLDAFCHILNDKKATDFIIIDALDECKEDEDAQERGAFFEALQNINSSVTSPYKIFITSRPEPDIKRELTELGVIALSMQQAVVDEDIRLHVRGCLVRDARFKKWPQSAKK